MDPGRHWVQVIIPPWEVGASSAFTARKRFTSDQAGSLDAPRASSVALYFGVSLVEFTVQLKINKSAQVAC